MTSRFSELAIDCRDPRILADFWCSVLGYRVLDESEDLIEIGPADLAGSSPGAYVEKWEASLRAAPSAPTIIFMVVPESKTIKNRVHIDVSPIDSSHGAEVERILALGAVRADIGQGDVRWAVLRDPEGNEFCVLRSLAELDHQDS